MQRILIFLFLCSPLISATQPLFELDSTDYFDFWVGEWIAAWDEGNGLEDLGNNTITKKLDGRVIEEEFRILNGQNAGFKGTSISVFQSSKNQWKQAWADNQGGYYDFTGVFDGEKRIFQTEPAEISGNVFIQRMVFYDINQESMTWDWEYSQDGGSTWILSWRIHYRRLN
jgi:hypothetical protein